MQYISTRGAAPRLDFRGALLAGLASDGGLYVPETLPQFSPRELKALARLNYSELAFEIINPFVGKSFSQHELKQMLRDAYAGFSDPSVAPLAELSKKHFLLELFHGPTLSFKDFALQLVGPLLGAALREEKKRAIVLGATSGDTGSAAIAGCLGQRNLDIVILYPKGRTSDVQRRQMTTTGGKNVHVIAVNGTFDDCQALVKAMFTDAKLKKELNLLAVNSINWARVMAQTVYYFYAAFQFDRPVNFCVPTGNFGNIFAGYTAARMGLPVGKLIIASNRNDILTRCYKTGSYKTSKAQPSLSPAMDIQVSSNFERLLFDLCGRDGKRVAKLMGKFTKTGSLELPGPALKEFRQKFLAHSVSDKETLATIKQTYAESGVLLDPHSAVGVTAGQRVRVKGPLVTLATAHPAKFPEAVKKATGTAPKLPRHMADLHKKREHITSLPNQAEQLKRLLRNL